MIIKDLFKKDITRSIQGVVTIGNESEEQKWQELEEYVCTDEITKSFRTFFRRYRESINNPTGKMGVWITGFFGSGKSHFLKILGYILENEEVAGWEAVKYFENKIKDEMVLADIRTCAKAKTKVVLFNIDSKAKSDSKNRNEAIMDIMLRSFNESVGYCGISPWVADMERTLDEEGKLQDFIAKFEEYSGRNWVQTRAKALLNRDYIIRALVASRDMSEESAKTFIEDQTRNYTNTTEEFAKIVDEYCKKNKTRVIFLMDEVGQFIGDNTQLMLNLQTCVEDLGKYCKGQAWVVITSQQELKAMIDSTKDKQQDFSKIQGRFDTRLLLSGANADEVIKRRILEKKEIAETPLRALYDANSSKLSNLILFQAKPTWSGYKDAEDFKNVYPFVSYQFELLQKVFEAIREHGMSEGRHLSQNERSLLSAFQNSAKKIADSDSGILVPFDSFYSTIEEFIDYDIKTVFSNAERRAGLDEFAIRVLRVLFMIKHVKEMPKTIDRLATLMVDNINADKAAIKNMIFDALQKLEEETLIQKNGEEYDFLTNAEQDVNKQIINSAYNEGEVQRTIFDIVYDKVLEGNKYRYEGRYDFGLNRYVDSEIKGALGQDNITIKVITQFSGMHKDTEFQAESVRSNSVVVDLTEGNYVDELIRANKIATFKRNNSASMSADLTEIMSKKSAELSDRIKRAEDIIRVSLKSAPIYFMGIKLDIKQKDGKDRLLDALKESVKHDYYKLGLVEFFYQDQRSILSSLNDTEPTFAGDDISNAPNKGAYDEIFTKLKDDSDLQKKTTVKSLLEHFSKKPFGWRDLDVQGMLGALWKHHKIQIFIHDNEVAENNSSFKNDLARKNNTDIMVVRMQEKVDEQLLYSVKRIMSDIYSETLPLEEVKLRDGVVSFFDRKKNFLSGLKEKYGSSYAGCSAAADIYKDFDSILQASDMASIFNEVVNKKDNLEEKAETLEQLEAFYKEGSNQQKNYQDAKDICSWYDQNYSLQNLSSMEDVVTKMNAIISLDMPFTKMNELANLVFQASTAKEKILEDKLAATKKLIEADRDAISRELTEVLGANLKEEQKEKIQEKADELFEQYDGWLGSITSSSSNMDSYVTASAANLSGFKEFISSVMNEQEEKQIRIKRVRIIDCVPAASKKVTSEQDVEKVVNTLRKKLLEELKDNDEVNLE
ncbi:MAG: BREX system P-loop protein BrxC [Lachnospiraceae bacterium]|nr:BREX system P-loop protein BrxC [Lachnospiraceae bacterium]